MPLVSMYVTKSFSPIVAYEYAVQTVKLCIHFDFFVQDFAADNFRSRYLQFEA